MRKNFTRSSIISLAFSALILMLCCTGCATDRPQKPAHDVPSQAALSPQNGARTSAFTPTSIPFFPTPSKLDICGEAVPLQNQEVYERFDREFTIVVYNHAQVYLWLKRMERYFPAIEERLRYYRLPDDLKYVAIAESDLLPNALSNKGAGGPWQFMPSTGRAYGMAQKGSYDERYDYERATDGAFMYLQSLYKRFNNWGLAIAAYNCGEKRVQDEMRSQSVSEYYYMKLPQETERYVFRILAIKAVLSNPEKYGYSMPKGQGYQQINTDRVSVNFSRPVPIQAVAAAAGTTFREIKRLNPTFRGDDIPEGSFELKLPQGSEQAFRQNLKAGSTGGSYSPLYSRKSPSSDSSDSSSSSYAGYLENDAGLQPAPTSASELQEDLTAQNVEDLTPPERGRSQAAKPLSSLDSGAGKALATKEKTPEKKPEQSTKTQTQAKASTPSKTHVVKKGETLSEIAEQYDVSVQELRKANKIQGSGITPGNKLMVP